ncbi:hypothetical protein [Streptomyces cinerochromogenes]|uniref:hypothetical protein n=1 Tax=Streptomyces cinerochromogenes TaxID=66422 RepID=UPI0033BE6ED3
MPNVPVMGGAPPLYASLTDAVRLLAGVQKVSRADAPAAHSELREALAGSLRRIDPDFRLKPRIAPVRQGPAGVLAYLLYESDRLARLVRVMSEEQGAGPGEEAAWTSLVFMRHSAPELSWISRRAMPEPHQGARMTIFDQLPGVSLRGLVPVALSLSRATTVKARREVLRKAEESELLTSAEEDLAGPATDRETIEYFICRTRNKQRWAAPLWGDTEQERDASARPHVLSAAAERDLVAELENAAARAVGLDVARLALLRSRFEAGDAALTSEDLRNLSYAAARLEQLAAVTERETPQSRAAHLVNVHVSIARENSDRSATEVAVEVLQACDKARQAVDLREASEAAAREVREALPRRKLQMMCEVDYLEHVKAQVRQALDGIPHSIRTKRNVLLDPSVTDATAETALRRLDAVFGGTCVLQQFGSGSATIRIPRPSQFGIRLRRAATCDCGRHAALRTREEEGEE